MKIGFDAKRAFHNRSGLGVYSRNLLAGLSQSFPDHEYHLFTPQTSHWYQPGPLYKVHTPSGFGTILPSLWRRKGMLKDAEKAGIELFHGLSAELPLGIEKSRMKSVVTVHDLIFLRFPEHYSSIDARIYKTKTAHACQVADKIIAISAQTKADLVEFLGVDEKKIEVVYVPCHPRFYAEPEMKPEGIRRKYGLPEQFVLTVGAGNERKNIGLLLDALKAFVPEARPQLVIAAAENKYTASLKQRAAALEITPWVRFLAGTPDAEMPALYHAARLFLFPSQFEGFGIPLLEAMATGTPVLASDIPVFHEVGQEALQFAPPDEPKTWAAAMQQLLTVEGFHSETAEKGRLRSRFFQSYDFAAETMKVYESLF